MSITARELAYQKNQKEYNLEISTNNFDEIKQEINKTFKKFKKYNNFDSISVKICIKYHENDDFLFYRGL